MPKFGIISEGKTDQTVLAHILAGYLDDPRVTWTPIQPPPDTGEASGDASFGGWAMVFKVLELGRHKEALLDNEYVVIQLDTDVAPSYGVPHQEGLVKLTPEDLVVRVVERLKVAMDPVFYSTHAHRFIFAIAVHEIECWILALHDDKRRHGGRTKRCLDTANDELKRKGLPALSRKEGKRETKSPPCLRGGLTPVCQQAPPPRDP